MKSAALQKDRPSAVPIEITAVKIPSRFSRMFPHPCGEAIADTIVGVDVHHMRRRELPCEHEAAEALSEFVLIEPRMIVRRGDRRIDAHVSHGAMIERDV